MHATRTPWLLLGAVFVGVFLIAAWYFAGVFVAAITVDNPAGSAATGSGVDWGRVIAAASVVALLATGVIGALIRLARP
jgi:hypothetical protein